MDELDELDGELSNENLDDETVAKWRDDLNEPDSDLSKIVKYLKDTSPGAVAPSPAGSITCAFYGQDTYDHRDPYISVQAPSLRGKFLEVRQLPANLGNRFQSVSLVEPMEGDSLGGAALIDLLSEVEVISWRQGQQAENRKMTRGDMMEFDGIIGDIKNELLPAGSVKN